MSKIHSTRCTQLLWWVCFLILSVGLGGCATAQARRYDGLAAEFRRDSGRRSPARTREPLDVDGLSRLDRVAFIRAVLARNPTAEASRQGWRAALAQYPQSSALPDPMVEYSLAPLSIGSSDVSFGQVVGLSQRFPWPGKLALQGEVALAEAEAAREGYEATRQRLALMASMLFDQYYAVARSLDLNEEHRRLADDIKAVAEAQYEAGRASQQEPLQAEVELSHVIHQRVVLESRRAIIVAQMNGLLHRRPNHPFPPPPEQIEPGRHDVEESQALYEEALANRPELRATRSQIQGRESAVNLAERQYYPDFGVMTSYNSMWMQPEHQWMVGLSLNIPIQLGARSGAVEQAEARLAQARSTLLGADDEIRVEVERARQQFIEAHHVVRLYRERLLPAVRAHIEAARIGYETGRNGFQALIDAERSVRRLEIEHQEAIATVGQRRAELDRAVGRIPGLPRDGGTP